MKLCVWLKIVVLALPFLVLSCLGVTETGNPKPFYDTFAPAGEAGDTYTNQTYGVLIRYPRDWVYQEAGDESYVDFMSEERVDGTTIALISFKLLDPPPESLFAYLFETYPNRNFTLYMTNTFAGYLYDDPSIGPAGGDLREYFFLVEDLLIHVEAEIFQSTKEEFEALLEGIEFF